VDHILKATPKISAYLAKQTVRYAIVPLASPATQDIPSTRKTVSPAMLHTVPPAPAKIIAKLVMATIP
jgi:hypothetical protein